MITLRKDCRIKVDQNRPFSDASYTNPLFYCDLYMNFTPVKANFIIIILKLYNLFSKYI